MSTQVAQQQMKTTGKMEVPTGKQQLHVWQEHEQVRALIRRVIDLTDMDEKQRQFNLLVKELSQHEVAEEVVRLASLLRSRTRLPLSIPISSAFVDVDGFYRPCVMTRSPLRREGVPSLMNIPRISAPSCFVLIHSIDVSIVISCS